jgi:leader peptidase (prepilin peptidase)/N-methyltransferase
MSSLAAGYLAILGAAAGAAVGSFAGVVRARGWRASLTGRSRCAACGRDLRWYEVVPLVSYPVQRGRCRSCGARIGRHALLVEVVGAAAGALAALALLRALGG